MLGAAAVGRAPVTVRAIGERPVESALVEAFELGQVAAVGVARLADGELTPYGQDHGGANRPHGPLGGLHSGSVRSVDGWDPNAVLLCAPRADTAAAGG